MMKLVWVVASMVVLILSTGEAFLGPTGYCSSRLVSARGVARPLGVLRATPDEAPLSSSSPAEAESNNIADLRRAMEQANTPRSQVLDDVKASVSKITLPSVDTSKPFRFPAYGYLGIAVLLGISFTGSIVELAGGKPLLGTLPTEVIIALAGPGALGTFYLAVTRFNEEAEEDNKKLMLEEQRRREGYDDDE